MQHEKHKRTTQIYPKALPKREAQQVTTLGFPELQVHPCMVNAHHPHPAEHRHHQPYPKTAGHHNHHS